MKLTEGLNYYQWQKRNSQHFKSLTISQQKELKKQGYFNKGWEQVIQSWTLLLSFNIPTLIEENNVINLFDKKLDKGDLTGAIKLSILESENADILANNTLKTLEETQNKMNNLVKNTVEKYSLL